MTAKLIPVGEPAHDAERQALRHLVEGLPDAYTIYSNPWLSQRDGAIYEIDAVVAAPHAIFVVELKAYRGDVRGTDYDWYTPEPIRSPLGLNRKTAQVLKSELRRASYEAGRVWVEGLVFLSHAASVSLTGEASRHRVHDRATIVRALTDASYFHAHLGGHVAAPVDPHTADVLHRVLTGGDPRHKPVHQIGQYQLLGEIDRADAYTEYLAQHTMMDERRVLRVYTVPWSAGDAAGHCHGARPGTCPGAAGPHPGPRSIRSGSCGSPESRTSTAQTARSDAAKSRPACAANTLGSSAPALAGSDSGIAPAGATGTSGWIQASAGSLESPRDARTVAARNSR